MSDPKFPPRIYTYRWPDSRTNFSYEPMIGDETEYISLEEHQSICSKIANIVESKDREISRLRQRIITLETKG